ncbi:MAG: hypothetical protein ACHQ51_05510 [Elusimicrobiota bacterium]
MHSDYAAWYRFNGALESARARATACRDTHYSIGGGKSRRGTPVYETSYEFTTSDGVMHSGVSYGTGFCLQPGDVSEAEWPAGEPRYSRLKGMRSDYLPGSGGLFVLIFPLIGLIFAIFGLRQGLWDAHLLAEGRLARAKLVDKTETNVRQNKRPVYALTLSFVDEGGVERRGTIKTAEPERLEDPAAENILYSPEDPTRIAALDFLPGALRSGPGGRLETVSTGKTYAVLILPGLTVLVNGLFAYSRFVR